jgi:putative restriction endonuclease
VGIEAAHIRWFNFGGPDELTNGLALCFRYHKHLDRGVLGFADEETDGVASLGERRT